MAHIDLPKDLPGILGPMAFRPDTAQILNTLAETLLRGPSSLSSADRELIAAYTSYQNNCLFCHSSHGAAAAHHMGRNFELVEQVKQDYHSAPISNKLKALLGIAGKVQKSGRHVTPEDIDAARAQGATDMEIHDTVLIAAAFCMYNRYVDGLGTWAPAETLAYDDMGKRLAEVGYTSF